MAPSPTAPKRNESSGDGSSGAISLSNYGAVVDGSTNKNNAEHDALISDKHHQHQQSHSSLNILSSLTDVASRVSFLDSTKTHHHSPLNPPSPPPTAISDVEDGDGPHRNGTKVFFSHSNLRKLALDVSLWTNIFILLTKAVAYLETGSLSILAALVDSILDVVSQWILAYTERRSSKTRSSAHYPAGASRLEPLGVLSCAALMGFASFGVLKEAMENLYEGTLEGGEGSRLLMDENWSSFWSMFCVVFVKLALWGLCQKVGHVRLEEKRNNSGSKDGLLTSPRQEFYVDSTLEALAQDHWNDCLSNTVAAVALLCVFANEHLWILDPIGAIIISLYIIFSWYSTGKEQIEQLTGKAAPKEFMDELHETANNFDPKMEVDVVRAYHFGPKFLVELEVVLPRDTLLFESHDLGMELQYEIESREEVERCFVHIDYESRPYDEHVVSKVPELRERYRPYKQMNSAVSI